ncbi:MAG: hypothetical protein IPO83_00830 [Chitinophagaceae bacterium]|nr:hypothetical protein [Chitinophagaceae bacterium]
MKLYFTCFSILIVQLLHAQTPAVEWAKCYGGTAIDRAYSSIQTSDGGYLVCGFTNSTDGDVTFNHGNSDAWLVKTDPDGGILWQKNIWWLRCRYLQIHRSERFRLCGMW